ncbi:MAG: pyridoxal-phosphate dependent enzyme [Gemmatimonadales bacterium]|nr:pyridoxal-phosphate dependent enzyme [Gemmatimonadales bacterium]
MNDSAAFVTKIRDALRPGSLGASWPTPLEAAPPLGAAIGVDELWLKREDRAGGNKVRGLEFLMAGARPGTVFVTLGGTGSTHCLATARGARALGCRAAVALFPQPETEATRPITAELERAALVVRAPVKIALPWAVLRAWTAAGRFGAARRWIPGGGAAPPAVAGHLLAGLELEHQMAAPPDTIVVPLGTGGTAAGIALAVAWLRWPTRIVAVRVAPRIVANRWRTLRLARRAAALIGISPGALALDIVNGLGRGYGYPSAAGERARQLAGSHGVRLDPTYGAKAFAAIGQPGTGTGRRVVFWHTFPWP